MQHYIGTDIIEIERIREAVARYGDRFLRRVYTPAELMVYGHHAHSLAASFASKEAVMKVLGTGARGVGWRDIETLFHPSGKPLIRLNGRAKIEAEKLGLKEIDVSLSHSRVYAIATAIGAT
ncbi:MAG: holo-[acyl-carrier-protein] synthase [Chloroflexi bacterium RBG_16_56_11]|nr:MAG: holo-[acyl-carrier-protein] synthase [Chloroflexi bacterium RBG_16_56_11]